MVDGASKLDEKLDGAPFAMFVLAALQLQLRMELSATSGNMTVCWSATTRANSTWTRSSSSTTRTRTRTSSFTLKTYQRMPIVRRMIWGKGWKGVRTFCHKKTPENLCFCSWLQGQNLQQRVLLAAPEFIRDIFQVLKTLVQWVFTWSFSEGIAVWVWQGCRLGSPLPPVFSVATHRGWCSIRVGG